MSDGKGGKVRSSMQAEPHRGVALACAAGIMALLIALALLLEVPDPGAILIAGVATASALFGYTGGAAAAAIMVLFDLWFLSSGHGFMRFADDNVKRLAVDVIGALAVLFFVCRLKRREMRAAREVRQLRDELEADNRLLQEASLVDALTGVRNRYALRRDFPEYMNRDVFVMMLDVDSFKSVNDDHGRDAGDFILAETGRLLRETFGPNCCYRYGGDEFLVMYSGVGEAAFRQKVNWLVTQRPFLEIDGERVRPGYSVGYVRGRADRESELRRLLAEADERMYRKKAEWRE